MATMIMMLSGQRGPFGPSVQCHHGHQNHQGHEGPKGHKGPQGHQGHEEHYSTESSISIPSMVKIWLCGISSPTLILVLLALEAHLSLLPQT